MTRPTLSTLFISLALAAGFTHAGDDVTIAFQTGVDPSKVAQADGDYEKATGKKIGYAEKPVGFRSEVRLSHSA